MILDKLRQGRQALEEYREAHHQLEEAGGGDHQPLIAEFEAKLQATGFSSIEEFFEAESNSAEYIADALYQGYAQGLAKDVRLIPIDDFDFDPGGLMTLIPPLRTQGKIPDTIVLYPVPYPIFAFDKGGTAESLLDLERIAGTGARFYRSDLPGRNVLLLGAGIIPFFICVHGWHEACFSQVEGVENEYAGQGAVTMLLRVLADIMQRLGVKLDVETPKQTGKVHSGNLVSGIRKVAGMGFYTPNEVRGFINLRLPDNYLELTQITKYAHRDLLTEVGSVSQVAGRAISYDEFLSALTDGFRELLNWRLYQGELTREEDRQRLKLNRRLLSEKYIMQGEGE